MLITCGCLDYCGRLLAACDVLPPSLAASGNAGGILEDSSNAEISLSNSEKPVSLSDNRGLVAAAQARYSCSQNIERSSGRPLQSQAGKRQTNGLSN